MDHGGLFETPLPALDVVVFAGGSVSSPQAMRDIAWELEGSPVQVVVAPSLSDVSAQRVHMRPVGGVPLILETVVTTLAPDGALRLVLDDGSVRAVHAGEVFGL